MVKSATDKRLTRHWKTHFLKALAETSNVSEAARRAGVRTPVAYATRRENSDFARLWHDALVEGYEHLELELLSRLRGGEDKDGRKYDNGAALRLLTLHRETMAKEHAQRRNMDSARARAIIDSKLEELRERLVLRRPGPGSANP